MFSFAVIALASALAASATNTTVRVGDGGLTFTPSSVMAQIGDTVTFQFVAKNHSVTQSTFASPCTQAPTGIDSGFLMADPNAQTVPSWSFTLNSTDPLWFFCAQTNPVNHCQSGMVFAVNPTAEKTFEAYLATAKNAAAAGGAAGASGTDSIIPPPTSLPTGPVVASPAASGSPSFPTGAASISGSALSASGSGFSTSLSSSSSSPTGGSAAAASASGLSNGAVAVRSVSSGAIGTVALFAAVGGLLL